MLLSEYVRQTFPGSCILLLGICHPVAALRERANDFLGIKLSSTGFHGARGGSHSHMLNLLNYIE